MWERCQKIALAAWAILVGAPRIISHIGWLGSDSFLLSHYWVGIITFIALLFIFYKPLRNQRYTIIILILILLISVGAGLWWW